jgi:hypothetical protein
MFADALALVRRDLWQHLATRTPAAGSEQAKAPRGLVERLTEARAYAA